jgi:prepilin-type N-terminal cleavage/methylation domain-containing protein
VRESLSGEQGLTLAEVMVVMTIMLVVMFALYGIFDATLRIFSLGSDKVEATQNARLGLERMEREIRAAYPYDAGASPPDGQLLATMEPTRVAFGNDGGAGDRRIVPATEQISYSLSASGPPYTLQRTVGGGTTQAIVEGIGAFEDGTPGLLFEYLEESDGNLVQAGTEADVEMIRITLVAGENGHRQEVSTVVALRNRG